jgi:hypothetical protein
MATLPIEGGSAPVTLPRTIPPAPAVMRILDRFNREELGNTIEVLVALLDIWDGDPDDEPNGDDEPLRANGDSEDGAWIEWHTMRGSQKRGPIVLASFSEDDEDDDPAEEDDPQGECSEDEISCGPGHWGGFRDFRESGPGCPYSDAGIADDGALAEAHGVLSGPNYGIDQSQPLGVGHEP